jgi:hypothetical protein
VVEGSLGERITGNIDGLTPTSNDSLRVDLGGDELLGLLQELSGEDCVCDDEDVIECGGKKKRKCHSLKGPFAKPILRCHNKNKPCGIGKEIKSSQKATPNNTHGGKTNPVFCHYSPPLHSPVTLVVPSPTSSSCTLEISTRTLAAGLSTPMLLRIVAPSFVTWMLRGSLYEIKILSCVGVWVVCFRRERTEAGERVQSRSF